MFSKIKRMGLSPNERKTFNYHLTYSILDGIVLGILALNEYILIKGLHGTNYQIGFISVFTIGFLTFSIVFNEILHRVHNKNKLLRIIALATRLPFLLFLFFPSKTDNHTNYAIYQGIFLLVCLLYYSANPLILPSINLFLKNNYRHEHFGDLYSYSSLWSKGVLFVTTYAFGIFLDFQSSAYIYIYPLTGVIGLISIFVLTKIPFNNDDFKVGERRYMESIRQSIKNMRRILKENKPYNDFQLGFMLYGFAWLLTVAVITIYFDKKLHISYSGVAFYKNTSTILSLFFIPYFGRLIGSIDPRRFAAGTFMFMLLFLFFMGLTEFVPYHITVWNIDIYVSLFISHIFYGLFGAAMGLLWYIGSAYFCKNDEVSYYQSIHLTLTGWRGLLAPVLGVFFLNYIDYAGVFLLGIISLAFAIWVMLKSAKKYSNLITRD